MVTQGHRSRSIDFHCISASLPKFIRERGTSNGMTMSQQIKPHLFFLARLRAESNKASLIKTMTEDVLLAIAEMARLLYQRQIPIMQRDDAYFDSQKRVLRVLLSNGVGNERKRQTLIKHRGLLDRMLRPFYLNLVAAQK